MARQARSILGIDINPREISVVEIRSAGRQDQIAQAGFVRTPPGAMNGDQIIDCEAIASALRGLFGRIWFGTRSAVIGVGPQTVITHVLEIPFVPEDETRTVVEGELSHLHVLPSGTGAFDYVRLENVGAKEDTGPQVLVMAAEQKTVTAVADIAASAGLQLVALEPSLVGIYRSAFAQVAADPSAALVSITYSKAEIAILDHGHIRLYRRADMGTDEIIKGRKTAHAVGADGSAMAGGRVMLGDREEAPEERKAAPTPSGGITLAKASGLATEVKRSIDYYRREFPRATPVLRICLATNDIEAENLAPYLSEALDMQVVLADPSLATPVAAAVAQQFEPPGGLRYSAAVGLAMHGAAGGLAGAPQFDLSEHGRLHAAKEVSRKSLALVTLICLAILGGGLASFLVLQNQVNGLDRELEARNLQLRTQIRENTARLGYLMAEEEQVAQIKKLGFPVPRILDEVSAAVDPLAGLTGVHLEDNGKIRIEGEAGSETAIVSTVRGIQRSPYFTGVALDSFESANTDRVRLWKFQIAAQLTNAHPEPAAGAAQ